MNIKQYDLVIVALDPTIGKEMKKTRPCVVLSHDDANDTLQTFIIAPITSTIKDHFPTRVSIDNEGKNDSVALDQMRAVDIQRIHKKYGHLNESEITKIKEVIEDLLIY